MASREQFETRDERAAESNAREREETTEPRGETRPETSSGPESPRADPPTRDQHGRVVDLLDGSLAESEVTVRQGDGWLAALEVRPSVECTWSGFDDAPAEVGATLMVGIDGESSFDVVATELLPFDGHTRGTTTLQFDQAHDVLETTTVDAVDFEPARRADQARVRTLTFRLVVDLLDEDGLPLYGNVAETDHDVVVEASDAVADD